MTIQANQIIETPAAIRSANAHAEAIQRINHAKNKETATRAIDDAFDALEITTLSRRIRKIRIETIIRAADRTGFFTAEHD
jgi:hypothetical protein